MGFVPLDVSMARSAGAMEILVGIPLTRGVSDVFPEPIGGTRRTIPIRA